MNKFKTFRHQRIEHKILYFGLTPREWEIVKAICAGYDTNDELAELFVITERSVRAHLVRIYHKMDCHTKAAIQRRVLEDEVTRAIAFPFLAEVK